MGVVPFRPQVVVMSIPADGSLAPSRSARLVYDIRQWKPGYAVTFQGKRLTRHGSQDAALANARLIAANFWAMGQPTMVRIVNDDQSISPVISFG